MPRYRLTLEYDGTPFTGWQVQPHAPSVQGALIEAITRFSGETVFVRGAGRTDAGVHALGQVAHFDLQRAHHVWRIRDAINYYLKPAPVSVVDCAEVDASFDARHSATGRCYLYRILDRRARPALDATRVWWVPFELDAAAMHTGAQHLVGLHDFSTFRASQCQANSPLRTLVRSMVGTLKAVGEGRWTPDDVERARDARDRTKCGVVAPPEGLYLTSVKYGGVAALGRIAPTCDG
jgi:tRNA pseudouridine38-40 synthase